MSKLGCALKHTFPFSLNDASILFQMVILIEVMILMACVAQWTSVYHPLIFLYAALTCLFIMLLLIFYGIASWIYFTWKRFKYYYNKCKEAKV